jgi:hypothetical protein
MEELLNKTKTIITMRTQARSSLSLDKLIEPNSEELVQVKMKET